MSLPITKAVIIYVLDIINEDIPLNSESEPVQITTDNNSIITPKKVMTVSAGNVEVRQTLANCIGAPPSSIVSLQ